MRRFAAAVAMVLILAGAACAGILDDLKKGVEGVMPGAAPPMTDNQIVAGLKEALYVGNRNAVASVSRVDGYFGNGMIRITVPEKLRKAADLLRAAGYRAEVEEFERSMNRAAEMAAPRAADIFREAIRETTFEDPRSLLEGWDTAATDELRSRTRDRLHKAYRPVVSARMKDAGVTRAYDGMMKKLSGPSPVGIGAAELERYVTQRALDGLFHMIGEEERKIRKDPNARVNDLLKTVFGG